ncbi:YraN family protein [Pseudoalteromonas sp. GB56]
MFWQPKTWLNSRHKGQHFEQVAQEYLVSKGLIPISCNYSCRYGEIDLIMKDASTIVFIEVKFRETGKFGGAINALTYKKQQRLQKAIAHYVQKHNLSHCMLRVDYVAIEGSQTKSFHWIKNVI